MAIAVTGCGQEDTATIGSGEAVALDSVLRHPLRPALVFQFFYLIKRRHLPGAAPGAV